MGLVKRTGVKEICNVSHYRLGDNYSKILAKGLTQVPHITKFIAKNVGMTNVGAKHILKQFQKNKNLNVHSIDLSENKINDKGVKHLVNFL